MKVTISKQTMQMAEQYIQPSMMISKWMEKEAIVFMRNFFSNNTITPNSISNPAFIPDGFDRFLPIVEAFVRDAFDSKVMTFLDHFNGRGTSMPATYADAISAYETYKSSGRDVDKDQIAAVQVNGQISYNHSEDKSLLNVIVQWGDVFKKVVCPRIIAACDYILAHFCDDAMISVDLPNIKFPELAKFFYLDEEAAQIMKFCFVFRATKLKLPRSVQNFTDRMLQVSQFTGVDTKVIMSYAVVNKKNKKFIPFTVETCSMPQAVWTYLVSERADSLESYFYVLLKTDDALPITFFNEINKENTDLIVKLLKSAGETKRPRHILLYGQPGTGKTSYMKSLCKLSGLRGYIIPQVRSHAAMAFDEEARASSADDRFTSIRICDERIASDKSVIIIDEADDLINCRMSSGFLFGGEDRYDTKVKSMMNQIMDETSTPMIWITNNRNNFIDPSCRRRFDYSVYFDNFNTEQREIIWKNAIDRFGLEKLVSKDLIHFLAEEYKVTPGGITTACNAVVDINPNKENVKEIMTKVLDKHCDLLSIPHGPGKNNKLLPCKQYSLEGLNIESTFKIEEVTDICKVYLEKKAKGDAERSLNMLFSGPSGTGKTELVKYIGSVLHKPVHVVHASSVLDMYVGNTEKAIAEAFKKAENEDCILFMDEVDGLLSGREKAQQSWQVSQVNEILCQMENFRGIFIAASNFESNLDSASIRRFTFKFKFDYLKEEGILAFYKRYFGTLKKTDSFYDKIKNMRNVAPGDFATVKMLSDYTKDKVNSEWIYNALQKELSAKKSNNATINAKPRNMGY